MVDDISPVAILSLSTSCFSASLSAASKKKNKKHFFHQRIWLLNRIKESHYLPSRKWACCSMACKRSLSSVFSLLSPDVSLWKRQHLGLKRQNICPEDKIYNICTIYVFLRLHFTNQTNWGKLKKKIMFSVVWALGRYTWNRVSCAERVVASVWRVWTFLSSSVI